MNNEQQKEKVKAEIKRSIEENINGAVDTTISWDAMKVVIRGKLIVETVHAKQIQLKSFITYTERLRELEQGYQRTVDPKVYQQIKEVKSKDKLHIRQG